jgi:hypothetical protein
VCVDAGHIFWLRKQRNFPSQDRHNPVPLVCL